MLRPESINGCGENIPSVKDRPEGNPDEAGAVDRGIADHIPEIVGVDDVGDQQLARGRKMRMPLARVGEALVLSVLEIPDQEDLLQAAPGALGIRGGSHEDVPAENRLALHQDQVVFPCEGDPLDGVLVDGLICYFYRIGAFPAPALAVEETPGGEIVRSGGGSPGENNLLVESLDVADAVDVEVPGSPGPSLPEW